MKSLIFLNNCILGAVNKFKLPVINYWPCQGGSSVRSLLMSVSVLSSLCTRNLFPIFASRAGC